MKVSKCWEKFFIIFFVMSINNVFQFVICFASTCLSITKEQFACLNMRQPLLTKDFSYFVTAAREFNCWIIFFESSEFSVVFTPWKIVSIFEMDLGRWDRQLWNIWQVYIFHLSGFELSRKFDIAKSLSPKKAETWLPVCKSLSILVSWSENLFSSICKLFFDQNG